MAILRRLARMRAVREIGYRSAARYIQLVRASGRWTVEHAERLERLVERRETFIACFWHGRLLMMPIVWRYEARMSVVASLHPDGQFVAQTVRHLGMGMIAGSSSRGGGGALRGIVKALKSGQYVGMTPDGPRGPRMRAGTGAVHAARLAQAPIVPLSYAASRRRVMSSWDRFVLPMPAARGVIAVGEPIAPPSCADAVEATRRELENRLNALTRDLDLRFGFTPIPAAPEISRESR